MWGEGESIQGLHKGKREGEVDGGGNQCDQIWQIFLQFGKLRDAIVGGVFIWAKRAKIFWPKCTNVTRKDGTKRQHI